MLVYLLSSALTEPENTSSRERGGGAKGRANKDSL